MSRAILRTAILLPCLAACGCCKMTSARAFEDRDWLNAGREFGDYSSEVARWRQIAAEARIRRGTKPFIEVAGLLEAGTTSFGGYKFLRASDGFVCLVVYFDAKTEAFEAMRVWTDAIDDACPCGKWWPRELWIGEERATETLRKFRLPTSLPAPS